MEIIIKKQNRNLNKTRHFHELLAIGLNIKIAKFINN
jgi:hypothetical protein